MAALTTTTPLFGDSNNLWSTINTMATTVDTQTASVVNAASTTDMSDPGAVVLLQMQVNQVTNAATAVSNLVKALQAPSQNAVSNLRQ